MALSFETFGGFPGQASQELRELQGLIQQQRTLLTQEQGFKEVDFERSILGEDGLLGKTAADIIGILDTIPTALSDEEAGARLGLSAREAAELRSLHRDRSGAQKLATDLQAQRDRQDRQSSLRGPSRFDDELLAKQRAASDRAGELTQQILKFSVTRSKFEKTEERLEQEKRAKEFRGKQEDILNLQAERQEKALRGELPVSEATQRAKQDQFEQFKEAQGRIGNVILGDTPDEAAARGTGAQQALEGFRERFQVAEEAERRGELSQGGALFQSALGQVPSLGAGFAGTIPQIASPFGLQAINQASSPFFQQQSLDLQRFALQQQAQQGQRKSSKSGLFGGIGGLAGAGIGLALAAPTGGLSLTQGALLGNIFGQGAGGTIDAFR